MVCGLRGYIIEANFVWAGGEMNEGFEMRFLHWPGGRGEGVLGMADSQGPVSGVAVCVPNLAIDQEYLLVDP